MYPFTIQVIYVAARSRRRTVIGIINLISLLCIFFAEAPDERRRRQRERLA
jgi:hypothetical protein